MYPWGLSFTKHSRLEIQLYCVLAGSVLFLVLPTKCQRSIEYRFVVKRSYRFIASVLKCSQSLVLKFADTRRKLMQKKETELRTR